MENIYPGKSPGPDHGYVSRNHEFVSHGSLSMIAGNDLYNGHFIALVEKRHKSTEFIRWLDMLDKYYPRYCVITIMLDNHSVHFSKETIKYFSRKPHRFCFVFPPIHAA